MWWDTGRHANRNPFRAVYQQCRKTRWQNKRFTFTAIVVIAKINGIFFNIGKHFVGDFRHANFGITHGRRRIAIYRTEVALTIYQHITHRKRLRHTDNGLINRAVAVWVIFTNHIADHAC